MKRNHILRTILSTLLCLMMIVPSIADVLTLPSGTKVIEDYAFYGDENIDEVVLPEGIEEIGDYAFAESGLTKINLPSTLNNIGDNALDKDKNIEVTAIKGTKAYDWAVENQLIDLLPESPLSWFDIRAKGDGTCYLYQFIGTEYDKDIVIPSKDSAGNTLTQISDRAFFNCSELSGKLVIPDTVTHIGRYAFYNCSGLIGDLIIPNSVTSIYDSAFANCRGFSGNLIISSGLTSIEQEVFSGCSGLTGTLNIPDSIINIGYGAFRNCSGFSGNLTIPAKVTSIGSYAFNECTGLTGTLTLPPNITKISFSAFGGCSGLSGELLIPESVTEIDTYAFNSCSGFTGLLTIPGNVTYIGDSAFSNCTGFTGDLFIPQGVTDIGRSAFYRCTGFAGNLIIPDSVVSIGNSAFNQCVNLKGILTIPDSVTNIGSYAFSGCTGFSGLTLGSNVEKINDYAFSDCSSISGNLVLPDSVAVLGDYAFSGCAGFTGTLTIGTGIAKIGKGSFQNCTGFTGSLVIPSNVFSIGAGAFSNCSGLNGGLSLPDSITTIGSNAFYNCSRLTGTLRLPVALTNISDGTFHNCSGFTGDLEIGPNVTNIGEYAFAACTGFNGNLTLGRHVTDIGDYAFYWCRNFTGDLIIPNSVSSIGYSAFSVCPGFTGNLILPRNMTELGGSAFYSCSGFTGNLVIPEGFSEIPYQAFSGCSGLNGLVLPYGLKRIGDDAFKNCSGLECVLQIPNTVTGIGNNAFSGCSGLTGQLTIPESVTDLGYSAFYHCSGFTGSLVIPDSMTSIQENTFNGCTGLSGHLIIPGQVTTVGKYAFADCTGLSGMLVIPESVNELGWYAFSNCINLKNIMVASKSISFQMHYDVDAFIGCDNIERVCCVPNGQTWTWFSFSRFGDRLREWDGINIDSDLAGNIVSFSGKVEDEQGNPLQNVLVMVAGNEGKLETALTNAAGDWWVENLTLNVEYHISCYMEDYTFEGKTVTLVAQKTVLNPFIGIYTPDEIPNISFTMTPSQICVGEDLTFTVSAPGATKIRLLIDGATYDGDTYDLDANGSVTFSRKITKYAASRTACFIAEKDGQWTNASTSQTFTMTSNGDLDPVKIDSIDMPHRVGNDLTVSWTTVDYADGFKVYLYNGYGEHTIYTDITKVGESKFSAIIPASDLPEGSYSLEIMAYGTGYSQSSSSVSLWVRPPYTEKRGWPQGERVNTYVIKDGEMKQQGWVDYTDSVRILDEIDGYYYIEMHRSPEYGGGSVKRYIKIDDNILVGEDENLKWEPELSIEAEVTYNDDGTVTITVSTNGAHEAGVKLGEAVIDNCLEHKEDYDFTFAPESGNNEYTIYASKDEEYISINKIINNGISPQISVPGTLSIYPNTDISDGTLLGTAIGVSTNVSPETGDAMNRPNDWEISYKVAGDNQGLLVFAVDYHGKEPVYQYVAKGIKQSDDSYKFNINPHQKAQTGYRVNPNMDDGFQHFEYDYVFVPVCMAQKVGHSYYIDHQTVEYLIDFGKKNSRIIVEKRRHYFIDDFSDDINMGYAKTCEFMDDPQFPGNLLFSNVGNSVAEIYQFKLSKLIINNRKLYAILFRFDSHNYVCFVTAADAERALRDVAIADQFNIEISQDWFGTYIAKISNMDASQNLSPDDLSRKYYLVAKWEESGVDSYKIIQRLIWTQIVDEMIIYEPNTNASLSSLSPGKKYYFAVVCTDTDITSNDNEVRNASFNYSYYIPSANVSEKDEALKFLVYAYDHRLNALTGKNLYSGIEDVEYCKYLDKFILYISNRIQKCGLNNNEALEIINKLKEATNNERNLYLFSIWDYEVRLNVQQTNLLHPTTLYLPPVLIWGGNNIEVLTSTYGVRATRLTDFLTTWFHESGHAADYNDSSYSGGYTTRLTNVYDKYLVVDFKNQVYKAANNTNLDSEVNTETYTKIQTDIIAECLMNNLRGDCAADASKFNNLLSEEQRRDNCSWNRAYEITKEKLKSQMLNYKNQLTTADRNALMFIDVELGMMDNLLNDQGDFLGHGDDYWYWGLIRKGNQEIEAFAEYYASAVMKVGEFINRRFFPKTCSYFDTLISRAVSKYRSKYDSYASELTQ